jgi:hypothetical protein
MTKLINNMKKTNNFRELVSGENGILSSKRVMGVVVLAVCVLCTCWLVYAEGGTQVVENLLQTLMIMAAALLGISSITGIWKKGGKTEIKTDEPKQETPPAPADPCETCQYNKKETA